MADKTTGDLKAVEAVSIGDLPGIIDLYDESLIPVEQQGEARHMTGRQWRQYASKGITNDVNAAKESAELAKKAFQSAESAANRAENAIQHPAIPDPVSKNWLVWDQVSGEYGVTVPPVRAEGQDFEIMGYYPTMDALESAVPVPEKGYAYGVGTKAPYDIYVWDMAHGVWVNNGPMMASGDMLRSVYDPKGKHQDIFAYADAAKQVALDADVGRSMAGQTVEPTQGTTVTAGVGAEIFNNYNSRTYGTDEGYETIIPKSGNIASGRYAHAEGSLVTVTGNFAHAEGCLTTASGECSHAEGGRFTGDIGSVASAYSAHAEGVSTTASASGSHSEGWGAVASGIASHAEGNVTQAIGKNSHAEGYSGIAEGVASHVEGGQIADGEVNKASGYAAHAEGASTLASGDESHAEGRYTTASGNSSHAEGDKTNAGGGASHSEGLSTLASAVCSHAEGYLTQALAQVSHAGGQGTLAEYYAETAIGRWNVCKRPESYKTLGDLFVIGKGTSDSDRSNIFRVNHVGVYGTSSFNSSGADYAELFEWVDGNPDGEDRVGRFVTLTGEHIRLATSEDDYILGVVSGNPSVVGDVHDDQWNGMYLYDIFGRPVWEDVWVPDETVEEPDPENPENTISRVIIPAHTEHRQKINPDYDNSQPYIPRTERPEWGCVGLVGKLVIIDDGTCQPDSYCKAGYEGIATASSERTKYRVMSRLDDTHIRVMIL